MRVEGATEDVVFGVSGLIEKELVLISILRHQIGSALWHSYHHGLGNIGLDIKHGSEFEEHCHQCGVGCRRGIVQAGHVSHSRLDALYTEAILETDGQSMERTNWLSFSLKIFIEEAGSVQSF